MPLARGTRLADIQAQQVEVGRIRLGTSQLKQSKQGRTYNEPVKLERFRLTSRSQQLIVTAAQLYGGEPEPWEPQSGGAQQWQVIIDSVKLPVIVPPNNSCSQFYEQWTGGRCTRRCDGLRELIEEQDCVCGPDPADKKAKGCKPTTRLSLMLADMPGVGIWRLETHGYYAAAELPAVADLLSATGGHVPARLEMEQRSGLIPDPRNPGKMVTTQFMVPVLHVEWTPAAVLMAAVAGGAPALGQHQARPALPTTQPPAALPAAPQPSAIVEQADPEAARQEHLREQWRRHAWYEERISTAPLDKLPAHRSTILAATDKLDAEFIDSLVGLIDDRVKLLTQAPATPAPPGETVIASQPYDPDPFGDGVSEYELYGGRPIQDVVIPDAVPPAPPQSPTPPPQPLAAPAGDRQAVWQQVVNHASGNGLTMSALKQQYGFWSQGGDVKVATGQQLAGFLQWLQVQP